ncbi:hypothetical protein [Candidatus Thiosymbion oneisti]|uniref:nSTAND1 domain-containing NTPase n=1 Tax=Candidatus Thiosymbion oneisti TaxID=589554 RepID=UPI00105EB8EF|nr:hypothetical protein [Candidatus Thiosymbion oneisti]
MNRQPTPNPFVGLRPFERADSLYYFGRDAQIQALLTSLHQSRFLALVGSSGCGKSSLIRAGLIPALEAGFLVQDRDRWRIATCKPGETPLMQFWLHSAGGDRSSGLGDEFRWWDPHTRLPDLNCWKKASRRPWNASGPH